MKKLASLLLAMTMCLGLAVPALADQSTTTLRTAYKDLDPRTEIYVASKTHPERRQIRPGQPEPDGGGIRRLLLLRSQ